MLAKAPSLIQPAPVRFDMKSEESTWLEIRQSPHGSAWDVIIRTSRKEAARNSLHRYPAKRSVLVVEAADGAAVMPSSRFQDTVPVAC